MKASAEALRAAARAGDLEGMEKAMSAGARVDAADENGNGALLAAAGEGRLDAVRWLLARGAAPDIRNRFGVTPLMIAARGGWTDVAALCAVSDVNAA